MTTNDTALYGITTREIPARDGNMRTSIAAGTEVRIVEATRVSFYVEELGSHRWAEIDERDLFDIVTPA